MSQNEYFPSEAPADTVEVVRADEEMRESYITYAMSVIAGRSLPDVRDGLKPVQRRLLYAMNEAGVSSHSSHRKSSSIVGDTMGDYHPHGDSSIYDALARMAQDFSLRYPLVDGQGNFGSIDDDPPAAMRYTEARLSAAGEELLKDIDNGTVDYQSNYDDRVEEPEVLPARFPNLLVNGSSGIAVGLSTNIPPHNLGEVVDATIHLIDNPYSDTSELMEHLPGPDFPTGAKIAGRSGIYDAYDTGKGQITVQAEYHVEDSGSGGDSIVITEIPFQQSKARIVERIADMVSEDKLEGVTTLRDESDRDGIRIVIELKSGAVTEVVENKLVNTVLEKTFSIQLLALVGDEPEELTLRECLQHYIDHRKEVIRRRSEQELEEKEDRLHILKGRLKALENVDDVVELIRNSETRDEAIEALTEEFDFSEEQATHIVRMQLGSLTSMEEEDIRTEYDEVENRIQRLNEILNNERELLEVIKDELREVKDKHSDERRTRIVEASQSVTREDLIPEEDIFITVSKDNYVKRVKIDTFSTQNRGGKGIISMDTDDGKDRVTACLTGSTHDLYYAFTNQGEVYDFKGYEIPEFGRNARGTPAVNLFDLDSEEEITNILAVPESEDERGEIRIGFVTRNGKIKQTSVTEFDNIFRTGIKAISLEGDDEVIDTTILHGDEDFIVATEDGRAIRFGAEDVSVSGRSAKGVNAIKTLDSDVVGFVTTDSPSETLLTVTENGYGKRTKVGEYTKQSRYGKGLRDIKTTERNGKTAAILAVEDDDEILVTSEDGKTIRTRVSEIHPVSRNTKGVTVMGLENDDKVSSVTLVKESAEVEEVEEETEE